MKWSQCRGKPVSSDPFGKNTFTLIIDQMHIHYSSLAIHTNLAHCYNSSSPNYGYKPFRILGPAGATHSFPQCYSITISSNTTIDSTRLTVTCFWHHLIGLQWTFWGVGGKFAKSLYIALKYFIQPGQAALSSVVKNFEGLFQHFHSFRFFYFFLHPS